MLSEGVITLRSLVDETRERWIDDGNTLTEEERIYLHGYLDALIDLDQRKTVSNEIYNQGHDDGCGDKRRILNSE